MANRSSRYDPTFYKLALACLTYKQAKNASSKVQELLKHYEEVIIGARALGQEYKNDVEKLEANYPLCRAGKRFMKTFGAGLIPGMSFVEGIYDYWWLFGKEVLQVTFAVALMRGYDVELASVKFKCCSMAAGKSLPKLNVQYP